MISEEKIYTELLNLYYNSGREFYAEMAAMLGQQTEGMEHTFLTSEEGKWKLVTSTIQNRDEREFLRNQADEWEKPFPENSFRFAQQRSRIRNHLVMPLTVKKRTIVALWVIECRGKERLPERELTRVSLLLALFFQLSKEEKNWYLDSETGLPGRGYFRQVLKRLEKGGHSTIICVFRFPDYRESVRRNGFVETSKKFQEMVRLIKQLQLGNLYTLSDDTTAVISLVKETEAYAKIENMLDMTGIKVLTAIIHPGKEDDIFAVVENKISPCNQIKVQEECDMKPDVSEEKKQAEEIPMDDLLGLIEEDG